MNCGSVAEIHKTDCRKTTDKDNSVMKDKEEEDFFRNSPNLFVEVVRPLLGIFHDTLKISFLVQQSLSFLLSFLFLSFSLLFQPSFPIFCLLQNLFFERSCIWDPEVLFPF